MVKQPCLNCTTVSQWYYSPRSRQSRHGGSNDHHHEERHSLRALGSRKKHGVFNGNKWEQNQADMADPRFSRFSFDWLRLLFWGAGFESF